MFNYNPYRDDHTAAELVGNIIDAIESMRHAIESGGKLDGQRAVRDRRFKICREMAGGVDEWSGYDVYSLAGIEFKVYERDWKHTDLELPLFDLGGYPWQGDVRFSKYGLKHDIRPLLLVVRHICERDGIDATEYVEGVLGWEAA